MCLLFLILDWPGLFSLAASIESSLPPLASQWSASEPDNTIQRRRRGERQTDRQKSGKHFHFWERKKKERENEMGEENYFMRGKAEIRWSKLELWLTVSPCSPGREKKNRAVMWKHDWFPQWSSLWMIVVMILEDMVATERSWNVANSDKKENELVIVYFSSPHFRESSGSIPPAHARTSLLLVRCCLLTVFLIRTEHACPALFGFEK